MSQGWEKGKAFTPEHRAKLSESHKAFHRNNPGRKHSPETKAKMSASAKAAWTPERRLRDAEVIKASALRRRGQKRTPEQAANMAAGRKLRNASQLVRYGIGPEEWQRQWDSGNRWCWFAKHFAPKSEFYSAEHQVSVCKTCRPYYGRKQALKRKYGVTTEWYDTMLASQGGGCGICEHHRLPEEKQAFPVDHNHKTGAVRGILCRRCNWLLERLEKDPVWLFNAIGYLEFYNGEQCQVAPYKRNNMSACLDCGGSECICRLLAENKKMKDALEALRAQPLDQDPDSWGIKCIQDFNAIIDEALEKGHAA